MQRQWSEGLDPERLPAADQRGLRKSKTTKVGLLNSDLIRVWPRKSAANYHVKIAATDNLSRRPSFETPSSQARWFGNPTLPVFFQSQDSRRPLTRDH